MGSLFVLKQFPIAARVMSGVDDFVCKQIKVSFDSGFNRRELRPYDAYVDYGGKRNVVRCTSASNGSIVLYGAWVLAACIDKDRNAAYITLSQIIQCESRLKHAGVELKNLGKEVVYMLLYTSFYNGYNHHLSAGSV